MLTSEGFEKAFDLLQVTFPEYQIIYTPLDNYGESFDFRLYFWGFIKSKTFKKSISIKVDNMILYLKWRKSLKEIEDEYLVVLKETLQKVIKTFELIEIRGVKFNFQKNASIYLRDPDRTDYTIENVDQKYFDEIVNYSNSRYEAILELSEGIEEILSSSASGNINKLELNLSVADIALLFRLLDEEKKINYKTKTEIYRFITSSFRTKKQSNVSENSIKNKFEAPDNTAISNIEILLTNLKTQLKKIQNK